MNEFWKPLIHPEIQNGYMLSSYGRIKSSIDDSIDPYEALYHSTNGYDYQTFIIKEEYRNNSPLRMYPIDELVALTFISVPDELTNKRVKVKHIDGDNRNNHIDNLEWIEDIEEWRVITYPCVKENTYEVSNWGRFRKVSNHYVYKPIIDKRHGYYFISLYNDNGVQKHIFSHRLVSWEFLVESRNLTLDVNHIDGIKANNHVGNIEWVDRETNIKHAMDTDLNPKYGEDNPQAKFNEKLVHVICTKLVEYNGDIEDVIKYLNSENIFNVSRWNIERIKYKKNWKHISDKYFDESQFKDDKKHRNGLPVLNEQYVHIICQSLVKNNMNILETYGSLVDEIPGLTQSQIYKIKKKYNWKNITDIYF